MSVHSLVPLIPRTLWLIVSYLRTPTPHPCLNTAADIALWTSNFVHSISYCQLNHLNNSYLYVLTKNVHFVVPPENDRCFRALSNAWTLSSLGNMTQCHGPILASLLNSSNDATLTKGRQAACRYVPSCLYAHFLSNFMLVSCNAVTFMGQLRCYSTILSPTLMLIHQTSNIIALQYALLSSSNSLQPSGHCMYHNSTTLRSAHTVYLCVLCGSENKQRLFPYTALTDWFL